MKKKIKDEKNSLEHNFDGWSCPTGIHCTQNAAMSHNLTPNVTCGQLASLWPKETNHNLGESKQGMFLDFLCLLQAVRLLSKCYISKGKKTLGSLLLQVTRMWWDKQIKSNRKIMVQLMIWRKKRICLLAVWPCWLAVPSQLAIAVIWLVLQDGAAEQMWQDRLDYVYTCRVSTHTQEHTVLSVFVPALHTYKPSANTQQLCNHYDNSSGVTVTQKCLICLNSSAGSES